MNISLSYKYSAVTVMLIGISVFTFSAILFFQFKSMRNKMVRADIEQMKSNMLNQTINSGEIITRILADNLINPLYYYDMQAMYDLLMVAKDYTQINYVYVYDKNGKIVHDGSEALHKLAMDIEDLEAVKIVLEKDGIVVHSDVDHLAVSRAIWVGDNPLGGVKMSISLKEINKDILRMEKTMVKTEQKSFGKITMILAATTFVLISAGVILSVIAAGNLTQPIQKLVKAAKQISLGDYTAEIPFSRKDEIGELIISFNQMNKKLQNSTVSKNYLLRIINNMNDTLVVVTSDKKIKLVNDPLCELVGYKREELIDKPLESLVSEKSVSTLQQLISGLPKQHSKTGGCDLDYISKNKTEIPMSFSLSSLLNENGEINEIICVGTDISDRNQALREKKQLEHQLLQAQKMETLGTFSGGIAHDFNNLLTPILGFTQLVMNELPSEGIAKKRLEKVRNAAYRAQDVVRQLLTFSCSENESNKEYVDIVKIIKEVVDMIKVSFPQNISIRTEIRSTDTTIILAVPTQIHQALMNLCINACHAMKDKNGVLEITLDKFDVDEKFRHNYQHLKLEHYLLIMVRDCGHGIEKTVLNRIFEPFFTTKTDNKGTGLGLSVVHGIIEKHQGLITVDSEVGLGTTFKVYLPPHYEKVVREKKQQIKPLRKGNERILLVDDDGNVLNFLGNFLKQLGHHVIENNDSVLALEAYKETPNDFDLAIVDQKMPRITGVELIREFHLLNPEFPVILMTGYSEVVTPENFKQFGIRKLLTKPIEMVDLSDALRCVLDKKT